MVRKARGRKANSRSSHDPRSRSRKPELAKTGSKARRRNTGNNADLEALRTEIRSACDRISEIERRLDETDAATKNAICRFSQIIGELNVRLTSVAANVFEVIAMAKAGPEAERPEQKFQLRSKLDGEIKR